MEIMSTDGKKIKQKKKGRFMKKIFSYFEMAVGIIIYSAICSFCFIISGVNFLLSYLFFSFTFIVIHWYCLIKRKVDFASQDTMQIKNHGPLGSYHYFAYGGAFGGLPA